MASQVTLTAGGAATDLIHDETIAYPASSGIWLGRSPRIWQAPTALIDERLRILTPGARQTPRAHTPNNIVLPLVLRSETPGRLDELLNDLLVRLDPIVNPTQARLTVTRSDGTTVRWIDGRFVSGLNAQIDNKDSTIARLSPVLRCAESPYWNSAVTDIVTTFTDTSAPTGGGTGPTPPPGGTQHILDLQGNAPIYPRWTINGPCTQVWIVLNNGAEFISFEGTLAAGESVTIDTNPNSQSIVDNLGAEQWSLLGPTSSLFSLTPVDTSNPAPPTPTPRIQLYVFGGAGTVDMAYRPLWLTN